MSRQYFLFLFLLFLFWCKFSNHGPGGGENFLFFFFLLLFCHFSPLVQYPPPHTHVFFGPLRKKRKVFGQGRRKRKGKKSFFAFPQKSFFLKKRKIYLNIIFFRKTVLSSNFPSIDSESDSIEFYDLFLPPFPELFPGFFLLFRTTAGAGKRRL